MMMNFRITALFLLVFFSLSSQAQKIIFQDTDHVIYYSTQDDSVKITVEVLDDNSIDLDDNGTLEVADDFIQLMWDLNASDGIDFGNQIDIMYSYDSSATNNLCGNHITGPTTVTSCGTAASNGYASVKLGTSVYSASNHVIYEFCIPKQELDYNNTLCARLSINLHTGGDPLSSTLKVPSSTDEYFVDPYNAIMLYEEADLGDDINACIGDTIWANADYPKYFWNTLSEEKYAIVVNFHEVYGLNISDNTCQISDSVNVNILTDSYCTGQSYGFPNIVTPNDDGRNDTFEPIIGQDLLNQDWTGAKLKVYNRWGIEVYQSPDNAYPIWDVRNEVGDVASSGTFFYTFQPPGTDAPVVNGFFQVVNSDN